MNAIPAGSFNVTGLLGSTFGSPSPAFGAPMPQPSTLLAQPSVPMAEVTSLLNPGYQAPAMTRMDLPAADFIQDPRYSRNVTEGGVPTDYLTGVDAVQLGDTVAGEDYRNSGSTAQTVAYGGLLSGVPIQLHGRAETTDAPEPVNLGAFTNFVLPDFGIIDLGLGGFNLGGLF